MGVFNFIETFFFISLGISFVLILLLVYHFKQRLNSIENKSDTMFEIINNMVQEITTVKQICTHSENRHYQMPLNMYPDLNMETAPTASNIKIINDSNVHYMERLKPHNEFDVDEEDDETDDESDDETDDESDDESDDEADDEPVDDEPVDEDNNEAIQKIIVSDDESTQDLVNANGDVKVIHLTESTDFDYSLKEDNTLDNKEMVDVSNDLPETSSHLENAMEEMDEIEADSVVVSSQDTPQDKRMEVYQKMSPSELKALVIQKGLSTDPSKLKKPKLLSLLESAI
jgi:hypothetical protein